MRWAELGRWRLTTVVTLAMCWVTRIGAAVAAPGGSLSAKAELGDQRPVALDVVATEIVEQATATSDEHEQATAGVVILRVDLEVLGEVVDPPREQRNLHFGGSGVRGMPTVLGDRRCRIGHA